MIVRMTGISFNIIIKIVDKIKDVCDSQCMLFLTLTRN